MNIICLAERKDLRGKSKKKEGDESEETKRERKEMVAKRGKGDEREETGRKEKKIRAKNREGGESEGGEIN